MLLLNGRTVKSLPASSDPSYPLRSCHRHNFLLRSRRHDHRHRSRRLIFTNMNLLVC